MSLLNVNLNEAHEPELIENGSEEQVRILGLEERTSKANNIYLSIRLDVPGKDNVDDIYDMLMMPGQGEKPKQTNRRLMDIKNFLTAFGHEIGDGEVDLQSIVDNQELVDKTAFAIINIDTSGPRPRNQIARYTASQA